MTSTKKQRIIILPGPHKTGSSSVQSYLSTLMKEGKLGKDWLWPANGTKAFSPIASALLFNDNPTHKQFLQRKSARIAKAWREGQSIVIGAELLDFVAALNEARLPRVFQRLQSLLLPHDDDSTASTIPEVVIMYRTPRASHLVSVWKQQIIMAGKKSDGVRKPWRFALHDVTNTTLTTRQDYSTAPFLSQWLCHGRWDHVGIGFNVQEILASQVNPMGMAYTFQRLGNMNVTIADMSGIEDLPNMVACKVLGVDCSDNGKVVGYENSGILTVGKRSKNPTSLGFSPKEMNEVEDILRMRDCYYYCKLRNDILILYGADAMFTGAQGWNDCCEAPDKLLSSDQAFEKLKSLGCRASSQRAKDTIQSETVNVVPVSRNTSVYYNRIHEFASTTKSNGSRTDSEAQFPGCAAILFLAMTVAYFRTRRRRLAKEA